MEASSGKQFRGIIAHYAVLSAQGGYAPPCRSRISGGDHGKATPVPMPNTAVKLPSADDTWAAAPRENRSLPDFIPQ